VEVFAKPIDEQEDEVFFYSMMFLVLAGGSGISMLLTVCVVDHCVFCQSNATELYWIFGNYIYWLVCCRGPLFITLPNTVKSNTAACRNNTNFFIVWFCQS